MGGFGLGVTGLINAQPLIPEVLRERFKIENLLAGCDVSWHL